MEKEFIETTDDVKLSDYNNLLSNYKYLAADFDNFKKRSVNAVKQATEKTKSDLVLKFLSIYDSMERMVKHIERFNNNELISRECSGFKMIFENLEKLLNSEGFEKIECSPGDSFNVNFHEAIAVRDDKTYKTDEVAEIYQTGWKANNKLVRPVKVVVGK